MAKILVLSLCKYPLSEEEFIKPIIQHLNNFEIKHYTEKFDPKNYDGIILSGTALKDNYYLDELNRFEWLKDYKKPVLGICAGMQIIALTFGSKLIKSQKIGVTENLIKLDDTDLFSGIKKVYELHNYSVTVPENFKIVLKARDEMEDRILAIKKDNFYCALFHPEVLNKFLIKSFEELC